MTEDTKRRISELEQEVRKLRRRMETMFSRKGGHIEGQVHIDGWIQLENRAMEAAPSANLARLQVITAGGHLQLIVRFPSGSVTVLGQD